MGWNEIVKFKPIKICQDGIKCAVGVSSNSMDEWLFGYWIYQTKAGKRQHDYQQQQQQQQHCCKVMQSRSNHLKNSNDWLGIVKSDTMSDPFIYYRFDANKLINSSICRMICFGRCKTRENVKMRNELCGVEWEQWWVEWCMESIRAEPKAKVNATIRSFQVISMSIIVHWYLASISLRNLSCCVCWLWLHEEFYNFPCWKQCCSWCI